MEQETEIEQHLDEQNQQLEVVMEALTQDPEDSELLELQQELQASIDEFQKALLEIKKARLLDQIQSVEQQQHSNSREQKFQSGQICRFKHQNMKWYTGKIEEMKEEELYLIKPLYPASGAMLQSLVVDGSNIIQIDDTKIEQVDLGVEVGSIVFALNYSSQIWEKAEVNTIDYSTGRIQVVYSKNGRRKWLDKNKVRENLSLEGTLSSDGKQKQLSSNDAANFSSENDFELNSEGYDSDNEEEEYTTGIDVDDEDNGEEDQSIKKDEEEQSGVEFHGGLGSVRFGSFKSLDIRNLLGDQRESVDLENDNNQQLFADWEKHGKGVASKLMHKMGYEYGKGLGANKQGRLEPVNAIMLPKNKGLGVVKGKEQGKQKKVKRRARGGDKARKKKRRLAAQALNEEENERIYGMEMETGQSGVFAILDAAMAKRNNQQILSSSQIQESEQSQYFGQGKSRKFVPDDRQTLIARQDRVGRLKSELNKLQQIADKNINQKEIYNDIVRKIGGIKMQISKAEKDVASVEKAVNNKEKRQEAFRF